MVSTVLNEQPYYNSGNSCFLEKVWAFLSLPPAYLAHHNCPAVQPNPLSHVTFTIRDSSSGYKISSESRDLPENLRRK